MKRLTVLVVGMVSAMVLISACGREQPASALVGTETVATEDREDVVTFTGTTLAGEPFDLADLRGRVVVINAWASWCPPCQSEMPAFVELDATVDPAQVAVVGLNVGDDPAAAQAFVDEQGMEFPNVVDVEGDILATIPGVPPQSLPSTVILDREGRIAARIIGPTDQIGLARELGQVLGASDSAATSG